LAVSFECIILLTDIVGLKIMITYQAPLGTEHWEPSTPYAEADPTRQMIDHMTEEFQPRWRSK